jgi:hypothetical protein
MREASMKKLTAILLTLCVSVALVGCSDSTPAPAKKGAGGPPPVVPAKK